MKVCSRNLPVSCEDGLRVGLIVSLSNMVQQFQTYNSLTNLPYVVQVFMFSRGFEDWKFEEIAKHTRSLLPSVSRNDSCFHVYAPLRGSPPMCSVADEH